MYPYFSYYQPYQLQPTYDPYSYINIQPQYLESEDYDAETRQSPRDLERRVNELERRVSQLNRQVNQLDQISNRHTRQLNRLNQRLRSVERQLNIGFSATEDGF